MNNGKSFYYSSLFVLVSSAFLFEAYAEPYSCESYSNPQSGLEELATNCPVGKFFAERSKERIQLDSELFWVQCGFFKNSLKKESIIKVYDAFPHSTWLKKEKGYSRCLLGPYKGVNDANTALKRISFISGFEKAFLRKIDGYSDIKIKRKGEVEYKEKIFDSNLVVFYEEENPEEINALNGFHEFILQTIEKHPIVKSSQARVESYRSALKSAEWGYFPTPDLSLVGGTSSTENSMLGDDYEVVFGLNQPIWTGGRITSGRELALAELNSSIALADKEKQDLTLKVIGIFGEWYSANLTLKALNKSRREHLEFIQQLERRLKQGVASESDLVLAKSRYSSVLASVLTAKTSLDSSRERLSQLSGRSLSNAELSKFISMPLSLLKEDSVLINSALKRDPNIKLAEAQLLVAESELYREKSNLYPDIFFRAEHQVGNLYSTSLPNESRFFINFKSKLGPGLSNFSNVKNYSFKLDSAIADVEEKKRDVAEFLSSDLLVVKKFEEEIEELESSIVLMNNLSSSYKKQFLAGKKSGLDVMNHVREASNIEVRLGRQKAIYFTKTWEIGVGTLGFDNI
tara:strand:- start:178 stop:1899 length:1722 start_codon:yes stop_codon:yes gene_type:complete